MKKNYSDYSQFCKENNLKEEDLISSNFYQFLTNNNENDALRFVKDETLFIVNIQSLSLKQHPTRLRIRSDNFLKLAKENKEGGIMTGIRIENKKYFLFFSTKYFFNYNYDTNQGNSFITFDYYDLINNYTKYPTDSIIEKNSKNKTIFFYVSSEDNFSPELFKSFNKIINSIPEGYLLNKTKNIIVPPISDFTKKDIRILHKDLCGLVSKYENKYFDCPCRKDIDIDFLKENDLNYTDIHHFAPKKFLLDIFRKQKKDINWNIIHDEINLIPLCTPCHIAIHKGKNNIELVKKVFKSIIESYKINNRYNDFIKYLDFNFNISIEDLLNFYLKNDID